MTDCSRCRAVSALKVFNWKYRVFIRCDALGGKGRGDIRPGHAFCFASGNQGLLCGGFWFFLGGGRIRVGVGRVGWVESGQGSSAGIAM